MASSVEVKGLKELGLRLKELSADMQGKIARSATNAGAQVIKKRVIELAPVAHAPYKVGHDVIQPGNIGKNVIVKRLPPAQTNLTSEHIVTVQNKKSKGQPYRAAIFNEFGTVKMSPRPFFRPAFDDEKGFAVSAIRARLKQRIDKAENGG